MKKSDRIRLIILMLCIFAAGNGAYGNKFSPVVFAADFTFTRNLTIGTRGDDVSALQIFLIASGFMKIPAPTGYFGNLTREGVRKFQEKNLITPSAGYFGPKTRAIVNQEPAAPAAQSVLTTSAAPASPAIADLQKQIEALLAEVQKLQTAALIAAPSAPAVIADGNGSPVNLKIPILNVDAKFQYNGLTADGVMEIPNNIYDVGWFTGSPKPGEKGNAVITGHVAQIRGGIMTNPGVFFDLNKLRAGDTLYILNDKGETVTFTVREIRLYNPAADATDVFIPKDGGAHLNIITCEGAWNANQLSYSERLVIFTDAIQ